MPQTIIRKIPTLLILLFSFIPPLMAYDLSHLCDSNQSTEETLKTPTHESRFDRFERRFSKYDGSLFKDMLIYSVDMFLPDELIRATKDIIKNRDDQGWGNKDEEMPKIFLNDLYGVALTTGYYYMQDFSRISERIWEGEACRPTPVTYDPSKDPALDLSLTSDSPNARGVTEEGIVLPYNPNFPKALYPHAEQPDGCSAEGLQKQYNQANDISNDEPWFTYVCNEHDRCYYTLGSDMQECNADLIIGMVEACNHIEIKETIKTVGTKNMFCGIKGWMVAAGADACARKYFKVAQARQRVYLEWVQKYMYAYLRAKSCKVKR